jgi:hypothetical protein
MRLRCAHASLRISRAAGAGAVGHHIVRSLDDLDARMPPYVRAYLSAVLANRRRTA